MRDDKNQVKGWERGKMKVDNKLAFHIFRFFDDDSKKVEIDKTVINRHVDYHKNVKEHKKEVRE